MILLLAGCAEMVFGGPTTFGCDDTVVIEAERLVLDLSSELSTCIDTEARVRATETPVRVETDGEPLAVQADVAIDVDWESAATVRLDGMLQLAATGPGELYRDPDQIVLGCREACLATLESGDVRLYGPGLDVTLCTDRLDLSGATGGRVRVYPRSTSSTEIVAPPPAGLPIVLEIVHTSRFDYLRERPDDTFVHYLSDGCFGEITELPPIAL